MGGLRDWLQEGFAYDLWANERWLEALPRFRDPEKAEGVMRHVWEAQERWRFRVDGLPWVEQPAPNLAEALTRTTGWWIGVVMTRDLERVMSYTTMDGTPFETRLDEIALHVINHGSYHRGHLRGLADAEAFHDFPETDLVRFFRDRDR